MKNQIIYNDIHLFSKHKMDFKLEYGAIYLGDIVDMAQCKKKDILKAKAKREEISNFAGEKYCYGNHELSIERMFDYYIENGVYYTHGHIELWGTSKSLKYIGKSFGASGIGRFGSLLFSKLRHLRKSKIKKEEMERLARAAIIKGCHTIVVGHKHPNKLLDFPYLYMKNKQVRIIVLPRGRNELVL